MDPKDQETAWEEKNLAVFSLSEQAVGELRDAFEKIRRVVLESIPEGIEPDSPQVGVVGEAGGVPGCEDIDLLECGLRIAGISRSMLIGSNDVTEHGALALYKSEPRERLEREALRYGLDPSSVLAAEQAYRRLQGMRSGKAMKDVAVVNLRRLLELAVEALAWRCRSASYSEALQRSLLEEEALRQRTVN